MSSFERAPYEILVELLELELKLVREGQFEQLDRAVAARVEYTAWLPATPPASAQEPLQRALQLQQQLIAETEGSREPLLAEGRMRQEPEALEQVGELLGELREAWVQIAQTPTTTKVTQA